MKPVGEGGKRVTMEPEFVMEIYNHKNHGMNREILICR
jgi:hypothetical protein